MATKIQTLKNKGDIILPRTSTSAVSTKSGGNLENQLVTFEDGIPTSPLASAEVGDRVYTEQNVVTSGESVTDSIDALDTTVATHLAESATYNFKNEEKKYKMISGVLQNVGGVWQLYQDTDHDFINIGSITSDAEKIIINTTLTGKIVGFNCNTSHSAVGKGITCGASVGAEQTFIYLSQEPQIIDCYISYTGTAWSIDYQYGGGNFVIDSFIGGELILNHKNMNDEYIACATPFRTTYDVVAVAGLGTQTSIKFIDRATGLLATTPHIDMRAYVMRNQKRKPIKPIDMTGAIWFQGMIELP